MKKYSIGLLLAGWLLHGCTWVEPTTAGVNVRVLYLAQVEGCKKIGTVKVGVLDKVLFVSRSGEQVAAELEVSGQNAAAEIGGDAAVAMGPVADGEQVFDVYRCRQ